MSEAIKNILGFVLILAGIVAFGVFAHFLFLPATNKQWERINHPTAKP